MTNSEIIYLSHYNKSEDQRIAEEEIKRLNNLHALRNYVFDGISIGKLAEKSIMRYFSLVN